MPAPCDCGHTATSELDADVAVTPRGEHAWTAAITSRWNIGDKPTPGYLLAVVAMALAAESEHPDPLVLTGHFLISPQPGEVTVAVSPLRVGANVSAFAARMYQGEELCVQVVGAFGNLGVARGPTHVAASAPDLPPPEQCDSTHPVLPGGIRMPVADRFDTRYGPASGVERAAWTRLADGRTPDHLTLLAAVDAMPPAVLNLDLDGWVPTVQLTVHLRGRPAPGWLRVRSTTKAMIDGYLDEEAEIWDQEGRLVAQSRRLGMMSAPGVSARTDWYWADALPSDA